MPRKAVGATVISLIVIGATWLLYNQFATALITKVYQGESFAFLNKMMASRKLFPLEHYLERGDYYFGQLLFFEGLFAFLVTTMFLPMRLPQRLGRTARDFLNVEMYPISLALFRFCFFALMLVFAIDWATGPMDAANVIWWSQFPAVLLRPLPGTQWFVALLPITPLVASITSKLLILFCFTAMIGLFSNISAWLVTLLAIYVMGIPQFYGTVNHYQHLIWFSIVLAMSPCGDVYSVDALFKAWRRADNGDTTPPGPSKAYGLPLRFVWLLIGVLYFFPGYYKWMESGLAWAFSDNLKIHMYTKWFQMHDWRPLIRIDGYPILYQSAAFFSLFFEITFIFFIFNRYLRIFSVVVGFLFHTMTLLLMRIPFIDLQVCYVVFLDWNKIFHRIGAFLYKAPLRIIYDDRALHSRRTIAVFRAFDAFGRVAYVARTDAGAEELGGTNPADHVTGLTAIYAGQQYHDFEAFRLLVARIPSLWPFLPLLRNPSIGSRVYQRWFGNGTAVAVKRTVAPKFSTISTLRLRFMMGVGIFLVLINVVLGFANIDSWPFSVYPAFQKIRQPYLQSISLELLTDDGQDILVDNDIILNSFTPDRFFPMVTRIINDGHSTGNLVRRDKQIVALWEVLQKSNPELAKLQVETILFYRDTFTVIPEKLSENPLNHELLANINIHDLASAQSR